MNHKGQRKENLLFPSIPNTSA